MQLRFLSKHPSIRKKDAEQVLTKEWQCCTWRTFFHRREFVQGFQGIRFVFWVLQTFHICWICDWGSSFVLHRKCKKIIAICIPGLTYCWIRLRFNFSNIFSQEHVMDTTNSTWWDLSQFEVRVDDRCQNAVTQWQVVTKTAVQTCQQSSAQRFAINQPFRTYFYKFVFRSCEVSVDIEKVNRPK